MKIQKLKIPMLFLIGFIFFMSANLTAFATNEETSGETTLSSNANLKRIDLMSATMEPEFSADVTDYTVTLLEPVTQLVIDAYPKSKRATIIASCGFANLKNGENKAALTVKAEDGTTKSYTFTIIKENEAKNTEDTSVREVASVDDGRIQTIESNTYVNTKMAAIPEEFVKVVYVYKEQYVEAAYFEAGELMLLSLSDENGGNERLGIYYSGSDEFMDYAKLEGKDNRFMFPIQYPAGVLIPDGFDISSLEIDGKQILVYALMSDYLETESSESEETESDSLVSYVSGEDFFLIYGINESGEKGWYLYDSKDETYQRFLELSSASEETVFDDDSYVMYKQRSQQRMVIIGILIFIIVVCVFVLVNVLFKIRDLKRELEELNDEDESDDDESDDGESDDNESDANESDDSESDDSESDSEIEEGDPKMEETSKVEKEDIKPDLDDDFTFIQIRRD